MLNRLIALACLCFLATTASAQQDAEGCSNHPLFTRLSGFAIEECRSNFDAVELQTGPGETKETVEGNVRSYRYTFDAESGAQMPSAVQVLRNYENAIAAKGGKKIYSGEDGIEGGLRAGSFSLAANGKEYRVTVRGMYEPQGGGQIGAYTLIVVELAAMRQEVEVKQMGEALRTRGSITLYINFATGKADIEADSRAVVAQIAALLKSDPALNVSIEGHTDNIGGAAANQTLSDSRARAVVSAVAAAGVEAARMVAKGWGQTRPVADNSTEAGRAKNRRVEIVRR